VKSGPTGEGLGELSPARIRCRRKRCGRGAHLKPRKRPPNFPEGRPSGSFALHPARHLITELYAENRVGHSHRLFDRLGIPLSERDLVRYREPECAFRFVDSQRPFPGRVGQ
jgi:hypothetical protein